MKDHWQHIYDGVAKLHAPEPSEWQRDWAGLVVREDYFRSHMYLNQCAFANWNGSCPEIRDVYWLSCKSLRAMRIPLVALDAVKDTPRLKHGTAFEFAHGQHDQMITDRQYAWLTNHILQVADDHGITCTIQDWIVTAEPDEMPDGLDAPGPAWPATPTQLQRWSQLYAPK